MRAATAQLAVREEALQGRPTNSVGDRPAAISSAFTNTTTAQPATQSARSAAVYTSYSHMRCWLLAVGPTDLSRILANAALNNTQVVTKLRLYVTEQACPRPNMSVVDDRTVCKCVSPIIALLLSTTGGIAGTTTDALGSARFTAASANPVAPAYRCSAVNGRVGYCGHLRPALIACASLSWAHGSWTEIRSNFGPNPGL